MLVVSVGPNAGVGAGAGVGVGFAFGSWTGLLEGLGARLTAFFAFTGFGSFSVAFWLGSGDREKSSGTGDATLTRFPDVVVAFMGVSAAGAFSVDFWFGAGFLACVLEGALDVEAREDGRGFAGFFAGAFVLVDFAGGGIASVLVV